MVRAALLHLYVREPSPVRREPEFVRVELVVAGLTEGLCVVTTVTVSVGIVEGPDRVDLLPVGPVGFRHIIDSGSRYVEVAVDPSTLVAVEAERLLVAILTIVRKLFGIEPVLLCPHGTVVQGGAAPFMTGIAVFYLHRRIILMRGERPGRRRRQENRKDD